MRGKIETHATVVLTICAVVLAGSAVHREFRVRTAPATPVGGGPAKRIDRWRDLLSRASPVGPQGGQWVSVEFSDFECPFCRLFDSTIRSFQEAHPGLISRRIVHFPLQGHRFAAIAATVAECAGTQGHFDSMHPALFAKQDSFGLRGWPNYARDAGLPDNAKFRQCIEVPSSRVAEGRDLGAAIGVSATPTIVIAGWQLPRPPRDTMELNNALRALGRGRPPTLR